MSCSPSQGPRLCRSPPSAPAGACLPVTHTPHYCGCAFTGTWPGFPPGSHPCLTAASPPCPVSPCPSFSSGLVSLPLMLLDQTRGKGFAMGWGKERARRHSEAGKLRASPRSLRTEVVPSLSVRPSLRVSVLPSGAGSEKAGPTPLCLTPAGPPQGSAPGGCLRLCQAHFLLVYIMVLIFKSNANFIWMMYQMY